MKKELLLFPSFAIILLNSCTYEKADTLPLIPNDNSGIIISFNTDIKPIITTYCIGAGTQSCHVTNTNTGANGDFTAFEVFKSKVDNGSIELRVLMPSGAMPPSYSLSPTPVPVNELSKLKSWIDQGALDN